MTEERFTDRDKTILEGRIYPAIKACVNNRYKIILSIFAYYSFIISAKDSIKNISHNINLYASMLFTFFIIHNLVNYWLNNAEEIKHEHRNDKTIPWIELGFTVATLGLVWIAFGLIK
jgi:hypothetical protein